MTHSSDELGRDGVSEWAQAKAWTLCNASPPCKPGHFPSVIDCSLAFARYIEAHEEPPVDPLLIEAREICARVMRAHTGAYFSDQAEVYLSGDHDDEPEVAEIHAMLRARSEGGSDVKG